MVLTQGLYNIPNTSWYWFFGCTQVELTYSLPCLAMRYSFYLSITNTFHIHCPNDISWFKRIVLKIDCNANVLLQFRRVWVLLLPFKRTVVKVVCVVVAVVCCYYADKYYPLIQCQTKPDSKITYTMQKKS